jgi:hypothetical protein
VVTLKIEMLLIIDGTEFRGEWDNSKDAIDAINSAFEYTE